jgi:hypothetical protein
LTVSRFAAKIRLPAEGLMRPSSVSMLRGATWFYVASIAVAGSAALVILCYKLLDLALQLASSVLEPLAREL